jgi:hypothetical protein
MNINNDLQNLKQSLSYFSKVKRFCKIVDDFNHKIGLLETHVERCEAERNTTLVNIFYFS